MEQEFLFDLYRGDLALVSRGLTRALADPLVIDGEWYWAADEGEAVVKRRVVETSSDLLTFFRLHSDLVSILEGIESAGEKEDHSMMLQRAERLVGKLLAYDTLVLRHKSREGSPNYLELPNEPPAFNPRKARFDYANFVLGFGAVNTALFTSDFKGFKLGRIDEMTAPYAPKITPQHSDPTYHGRLDFVRAELVSRRFGFNL